MKCITTLSLPNLNKTEAPENCSSGDEKGSESATIPALSQYNVSFLLYKNTKHKRIWRKIITIRLILHKHIPKWTGTLQTICLWLTKHLLNQTRCSWHFQNNWNERRKDEVRHLGLVELSEAKVQKIYKLQRPLNVIFSSFSSNSFCFNTGIKKYDSPTLLPTIISHDKMQVVQF